MDAGGLSGEVGRHHPGLDGLRGVAVLAVLAFHGGFSWAKGGFLGVSTFFTLSGFLITSLLVAEWQATGRIDVRAFWARRLRRLMPAALLTLAGVVLFGALVATPEQLRGLRGDVLAALGDVANWRMIAAHRSYADLFSAPSPVQHFWSLAIEEQFYVLFPLLAALCLGLGRRRPRRALGGTLALLAAGSVALMALGQRGTGDPSAVYYGTHTRAAELLVGALLAVVTWGGASSVKSRRGVVTVASVGVAASTVLVVWWATTSRTAAWLYHGGLALHALMSAAVVLAAIGPGPVRAVLSRQSLQALGRISYGVYLFHWPVFLWLDEDRTGLGRGALFGARAFVTLTMAAVSFRLLEVPVRRGRRLVGWRPWVAAPIAAMSLAAGLVAVTAHPPAPSIIYAAASAAPPLPVSAVTPSPPTTPLPPTTATPTKATEAAAPTATTATTAPPPPPPALPRRVMIVGDSVATTLGRGLERWGRRSGQAVVWNAATYFCGVGRGGVMALMGAHKPGPVCDGWAKRWARQLDRFHPDVVVVLSTVWDLMDRRLPTWSGFHRPGDPLYDRWLTSEYQAAADVLASRGGKVSWLTTPCIRSNSAGTDTLVRKVNGTVIAGLAASRPSTVRVIDLYDRICPGGAFSNTLGGVKGARPDGLHFSDRGADWVARWLGPDLVALQ